MNRKMINDKTEIQIRNKIIGCDCKIKNFGTKKIEDFDAFDVPLEFNDNFELSQIPISGPIYFSVNFKARVIVKMTENLSTKYTITGEYGPVKLCFTSDYVLEFENAFFSYLVSK